jgi:hypothetical protein
LYRGDVLRKREPGEATASHTKNDGDSNESETAARPILGTEGWKGGRCCRWFDQVRGEDAHGLVVGDAKQLVDLGINGGYQADSGEAREGDEESGKSI